VSMCNSSDRVEIITSVQRRRRWTAFEKVRMVEETFESSATVSLVARRHGVAPDRYSRGATWWRRPALLDNKKPTPDEISAAAAARESATGGTYLDNTDEDELWVAYAINTVSSGRRYAGLGRTAVEAKANAWINSHWPGGTTSALVEVSTKVPDGWTFELYPPPKRKPEMFAISARAIFELVRRKVITRSCRAFPTWEDDGNESRCHEIAWPRVQEIEARRHFGHRG
jgi:transposase-like protein